MRRAGECRVVLSRLESCVRGCIDCGAGLGLQGGVGGGSDVLCTVFCCILNPLYSEVYSRSLPLYSAPYSNVF